MPFPDTAIVPLTGADADPAARLYTEVFLADEPTSRRRALDPELFYPFARSYVQILVGKDLSFVARTAESPDLAGFIFCVDVTNDPASEGEVMVEFLSHFRDAVAMIQELEEQHLDLPAIRPGSVLHIFQIGVRRDCRGRGIAAAMIRRALDHARERGFIRAIADCTNPASKRVFSQCGFSELGFLAYDAFTFNGIRFFAGLEGGITLMGRDL
jgi:ribosomal protein S18 acetylase RimI-like enzyme